MSLSNFSRKLSHASLANFHLFVFATCLVGFATTAIAQQGLLEEIIVTAQKREQSVQDVGI